jgi:hypothetical protein
MGIQAANSADAQADEQIVKTQSAPCHYDGIKQKYYEGSKKCQIGEIFC